MCSVLNRVSTLGAVVVFGLVTGCGNDNPTQPQPSDIDQQMMRLVSLHGSYRAKHHKAPASVDELKKWAKSLKPDELARLGVTDVNKLFISPRDNQPFQMTKAKNDTAAKMGAQGLIFYEKEGVNGKHMGVAGMGARPYEIERKDLKDRVPEFSP